MPPKLRSGLPLSRLFEFVASVYAAILFHQLRDSAGSRFARAVISDGTPAADSIDFPYAINDTLARSPERGV